MNIKIELEYIGTNYCGWQKQRNSLISSSNSINSIRDSVSNFSKGLGRTSSLASGIIDQTRKTNIFTSRLIRKDDEYFNKRRENSKSIRRFNFVYSRWFNFRW